MMYIQANKHPKLIAQLLLLIFLLESCYNTNNSLHPQLNVITKSSTSYSTLHPTRINTNIPAIENGNLSISKTSSNKLYLEQNQSLYKSIKHSYPEIIHEATTTAVHATEHNFLITKQPTKLISPVSEVVARLPKLATSVHSTINSHTRKIARDQENLKIGQKKILKNGSLIPNNPSHNLITLLRNQVCITKEGHQVKFKNSQDGNLQAIIKQQYITGFPKQILPIIIEPGFNFSIAAVKNPTWQKQYIHILNSCVYIGSMGILGGGKGEKEADIEPEEKEANEKLQTIHKIEDLQNFIEVAAKNAEKAKGKNIVLVLGNTGSGKSTIINYLLGSELEQVDNEEGDVIVVSKDPQKEWAKIGHGLTSETFLPSVYAHNDCPFVYCDCPGFNDNRISKERINTTISTQLIVNAAERIHAVIIVIDVMDLTHGRGAGMRNLSNILSQLFKGNLAPNSLLFVFNNKTERKMKLDNIHLKVKALEKSVSEQVEKLAKIQEQEEESQEEHENNCQILSMLRMISTNKDNTFLINLFDEFESKKTIEDMLSGLQAIPKDSFSFSEYDDTRVKFNNQLTKVVADLSEKMIDLVQATESIRVNIERIESCEERIDFFTSQIALLNPEQKIKNEDKIPLLEEQINRCDQKNKKLDLQRAESQNKLNDLINEKAKLDTDEEILYWEDTYKYDINTYHFKNSLFASLVFGLQRPRKFEYNGIPFSSVKLKKLAGDFINEYINTEAGIYRIEYVVTDNDIRQEKSGVMKVLGFTNEAVSDLIKEGEVLAKVKIYVKNKDLPAVKARIKQIDQELTQEQKILEEHNQDIEELEHSKENTEALIKYYNKDIQTQRNQIINRKQFLTEELARIEREKAPAELKQQEQQKIKEESEKYLAEKRQLLVNVSTIISHGIGGNSKFIEKFKEYYQHYTALLEQGPDYFLSLPEKNLPAYLFCPLRGDIFIDPIITACGHTFSQLELLMWLNKNKTCPTCREQVAENEIKPNLSIREAIEEFKEGEKENI